jgi:AcrR family transcriptional regulator
LPADGRTTTLTPVTIRRRILDAAATIFAEAGFRGATTRRIADRAGVNEVTIFRTFGSKRELIREAIRSAAPGVQGLELFPAEPVDPRAELTAFATSHLARLRAARTLIRKCMGESTEHPEIMSFVADRPVHVRDQLRSYLERALQRGLLNAGADLDAAAVMLTGVLFADAMGRDIMPALFRYTDDEAPRLYVDLLLRALGGPGAAPSWREGDT